MSKRNQTWSAGRTFSLLLLVVSLIALPTARVARAGSIFDDDSGWDDPSMDLPRQHTDANHPKTTNKPKPEVKPKPEAPHDTPEPAPASKPEANDSHGQQPAPTDSSLSSQIPDPKAALKDIDSKIKAMGGMKLDNPQCVHLIHMRAVCYLLLGDLPSAKKTMELVLKSKMSNRSVVLNAARIDIASNINAPRGMIGLAAYLEKNPTDDDAFTLYGSSLAANARRNKGRGLPQDKIDLYTKLLAGLEAAHPGQKRWGNDWMDSGAYQELMRKRDETTRELNEVWREYQRALSNENEVVRRNPPVKQGMRFALLPYEVDNINRAENETDEAYEKVKDARAKVPKPRWTYSMTPVMPDPKLQLPEKAVATAATAAPVKVSPNESLATPEPPQK